MAQRNIAALCEAPGRGLDLSFDENGGLLTLTADGELYVMWRIDVTLDQLLQADADRRASLFDRIGLEVQRSLDNFDRQYSALQVSKVLLGPHPLAQEMLGFLRDYLSVPVEALDLAQVADFPSVPELGQPGRQAQRLEDRGRVAAGGRSVSRQINLYNPALRQPRELVSAFNLAIAAGVCLLLVIMSAGAARYAMKNAATDAASAAQSLKSIQDRLVAVNAQLAAQPPNAALQREVAAAQKRCCKAARKY